MTGATIYAFDAVGDPVNIAAAWGQNPVLSGAGDDEALDLGTQIPPQPTLQAGKSAALFTDADGDGQITRGDTLEYRIRITNVGQVDLPAGSWTIVDNALPLFEGTTYVPGSTFYDTDDGSLLAIPDDTLPNTPFPLDEPGLVSQALLPARGGAHEVIFQVVIDEIAECEPIVNNGEIRIAGNPVDDFEVETPVICTPAIEIEKLTNGADADDPNGADVPQLVPDSDVTWTYIVTNTGNVTFAETDVAVTDDIVGLIDGGLITDKGDGDAFLSPNESWTYTLTVSGGAQNLQSPAPETVLVLGCNGGNIGAPGITDTYENIGTVTVPGATDEDPSHYCNPPAPGVDIVKFTEGQDANDPNGVDVPRFVPGATVTWTYRVTNIGNTSVPAGAVSVTDNWGFVASFDTELIGDGDAIFEPGEVWLYQATGIADNLILAVADPKLIEGVCTAGGSEPPRTAYTNLGTVTIPGDSADDPSSYCNPPPSVSIVKLTNDLDANDSINGTDIPVIDPQATVTWTYLVTNTGPVALTASEVTVVDNIPGVNPVLVAESIAADGILQPDEVWTYEATGIALNLINPPDDPDLQLVDNACNGAPDSVPGSTAYTNLGTVLLLGAEVDNDPSSYCGPPPSVSIVKLTNDLDANDPVNGTDIPVIDPQATVTWTYLVTNTGPVALTASEVTVVDNIPGVNPVLVAESIAADGILQPDEVWTYEATGIALNLINPPDDPDLQLVDNACNGAPDSVPGSTAYTNLGTVLLLGAEVDNDPSSYCGPPPSVSIVKLTNDLDANDPINGTDIPVIDPQATVTWTYLVTNTGPVALTASEVTVVDNIPGVNPVLVAESIAADGILQPDEVWTYEATGIALNLINPPDDPDLQLVADACNNVDGSVPGSLAYTNTGTVRLLGEDADADDSSYCGPPPSVSIVKLTNGEDANDPVNGTDIPVIDPQATVTWTYLVTNTGPVALTASEVTVVDNIPGVNPVLVAESIAADDILQPDEVWTYEATGIALNLINPPDDPDLQLVDNACNGAPDSVPGSTAYTNLGTVLLLGAEVDNDPSSYCGPPPSVSIVKLTNDLDANDPVNGTDIPVIDPQATVTWTYLVTNTGPVALTASEVTVVDNIPGVNPVLVAESIAADGILQPDEVWTYEATGIALNLINPPDDPDLQLVADACNNVDGSVPGSLAYTNTGTVRLLGEDADADDSSYCGPPPSVSIVKLTNDLDANDPINGTDIPVIDPQATVTWTYLVTNTGPVALTASEVTVVDNIPGVNPVLVAESIAADGILQPDEVWTYEATGIALNLINPPDDPDLQLVDNACNGAPDSVPGSTAYTNLGTVLLLGAEVDNDPSSYCGPPPSVSIVKLTNDLDANDPVNGTDIPVIDPQATVTWTYLVTNTGPVALTASEVTVVDNIPGVNPVLVAESIAADGILQPDEVWTYEATGIALNLINPPDDPDLQLVDNACNGAPDSVPGSTAYTNLGTVLLLGAEVDNDPSSYCGPPPSVSIVKLTNDLDANDPINGTDIPVIDPQATVTWTYLVTNTGPVDVNQADIEVLDNIPGVNPVLVAESILADGILQPDEVWTYEATGIALNLVNPPADPGLQLVAAACNNVDGSVPGSLAYTNTGTVRVLGEDADADDSSYCGPPPSVSIVKLTNGEDANDPVNGTDIPVIDPQATVTWTYLVTNTGPVDVNQADIEVLDNIPGVNPVLVAESILADGILQPDEVWTYEATGIALNLVNPPADPGLQLVAAACNNVDGSVPGSLAYTNTGTVRVLGEDADADDSSYCGPPPSVSIVKLTNGEDANDPVNGTDIPVIDPQATVTWTYLVTNTGPVALTASNVIVTDNIPGVNPALVGESLAADGILEPGEIWTYEAQGQAINLVAPPSDPGLQLVAGACNNVDGSVPGSTAYTNLGTVTVPGDTAEDPSSYCGPPLICDLAVEKTCRVVNTGPDLGTGSCEKPIDVLTLENASGKDIAGVTWYRGAAGSSDVAGTTTEAIQAGEVFSFPGFQPQDGNDVQMVIAFSDGSQATSEFHLSCSDDEMDGPEDCGRVIGDGKSDDLPAGKFWAFRGSDGPDGGIRCAIPAPPGFPSESAECTFTPEPQAQSCAEIKDLTALTMVWEGPSGVELRVRATGETIAMENGEVVTFGVAGLPNDVDVDLSLQGASYGTSTFHISCSDDEMNGVEDCGLPQGNGKGNDSGLINQFVLGGMTGENGELSCPGIPGSADSADVVYGIRVANPNADALTAHIVDAELGIDITETIPAGGVYETVTDAVNILPDGSGLFENRVDVTAETVAGATCEASDTVLVTRIVPLIQMSCDELKDVVAVSLIWDGEQPVDVFMESGETFLNVQPSNKITFQEAGTGNDVEMTIYLAGTSQVIGTSVFHVSCSDDELDGPEDCGTNQGNGKGNDAGKINDWLLDGMIGERGSLACALPNSGVVDAQPGVTPADGVTGAIMADLSDAKQFSWDLTNNGEQDVYLTSLRVVWPDGTNGQGDQGQLTEISLDGEIAKDLNDDSSPTELPSPQGFTGNQDDRRLKAGDTKTLEIKFTEPTLYRGEESFQVEASFSNGDLVVFSPSPAAVTGAANLDLTDKMKAKWALTNNTTGDVLITDITVTWPSAAHGLLKKIKLAGDFGKDLNDNSSPTSMPSEFPFVIGKEGERTLKHGQTKDLEIEFTTDYAGHVESEFSFQVTFSNGDTVVFP
ncbi:MAG: hypothetical protein N838_20375 [Thiohalocapsa sp. PB-PSB1]|nr:MAG: hypothetical protein N838_20375 [Thiohalocapsa sp. PB-PSB1]